MDGALDLFHQECLNGCKKCHPEEEHDVDFLKLGTALLDEPSPEPKKRKELIDAESTGRKRAAKLYPIDQNKDCEWKGLKNCGGGRRPIVGCMDGEQAHRHHGPVKKTTYNHEGNVHRICTNCLSPGTRLLTADLRWVPIEQLIIGDSLIGFPYDLKNNSIEFTTVIATKQAVEPCYKIIMEDGTEFIASHNHKWIADAYDTNTSQERRWRTTESLSNKSVFRRYVKPWSGFINSWESGWLAGMYDGEGCLQRNRLIITQRTGSTLTRIGNILDKHKIDYVSEILLSKNDKQHNIGTFTMNNRDNVMKTLGMFRPPRLIANDKLHPYILRTSGRATRVGVHSIEFIGEHEVVALETSSGTYIAEGYMTKNCHVRWHELNDLIYTEEDYNLLPHEPMEATGQEIVDNEMAWRSGEMKKKFELKSSRNNKKVLEEVDSNAD